MNVEMIFSVAGLLAMVGWLALLVSPMIPHWSDKIAGLLIPVLLSAGYTVLAILFFPDGEGGFGSLADVARLFSQQEALLAGWIHFLAFDLLIGAWECRIARQEKLSFWLVVPCLLLTFMFGPAGFLVFSILRGINRVKAAPAKPVQKV